jgi:pimeloyl-ACP methyl ester carboxylesterase
MKPLTRVNASQHIAMKTIRTELLETVYLDNGPQDGEPLLFLHGWPDSPVGFEQISSRLNEAGFRTIAPFLRGFGATRFLSPTTARIGGPQLLRKTL